VLLIAVSETNPLVNPIHALLMGACTQLLAFTVGVQVVTGALPIRDVVLFEASPSLVVQTSMRQLYDNLVDKKIVTFLPEQALYKKKPFLDNKKSRF
jgi:hypothetical protein